jgi:hypothetical protein
MAFVVYLVIALVILAIGYSIGFGMLSKRRAILNTPQHDAGMCVTEKSAREGLVVPLNTAQAPFSGEEVVYCEAKAKQMPVNKGKVQSQVFTDTIYEFCMDDPFLLKGEDGYVLVCPQGGFIDIDRSLTTSNYSHKGHSIVARQPDPPMLEALRAAEASFTDGDGPVPIDFYESNIKEGERVFVMGMRYHDPEAIERILGDHPIGRKEKIVGLFRHSEETNEGLYLTNGHALQAAGSLKNYGVAIIFFSTLIGGIFIALAISKIL